MTTTQTIIGRWSVVEQQWRFHGEWLREYVFEPGEWTIDFHPNGRMNIEFRAEPPLIEYRSGGWAHDPASGIILFDLDDEPWTYDAIPEDFSAGMIFDPADDGPWLYLFDDDPHIRLDRDTIIAHHAHERHRLFLNQCKNPVE